MKATPLAQRQRLLVTTLNSEYCLQYHVFGCEAKPLTAQNVSDLRTASFEVPPFGERFFWKPRPSGRGHSLL